MLCEWKLGGFGTNLACLDFAERSDRSDHITIQLSLLAGSDLESSGFSGVAVIWTECDDLGTNGSDLR